MVSHNSWLCPLGLSFLFPFVPDGLFGIPWVMNDVSMSLALQDSEVGLELTKFQW